MNIKKKRILFVVGIMILICCVFAGSYAFWTVTKEQNDTNNLVAACLDLELIEETGTFGVNNAWPISDEEGLELEGYSFKVKNNCSETVNYIIGIDSLSIEGAEYLDYSNIKVSLDSASPKVFGSLTDIEKDNVRESKQVEIKTIEGNTTNSHNIKLWIKDTADVSEQSKQFKGQVFITGGQGINIPQSSIVASGNISRTEECTIVEVSKETYEKECTPTTGNNVTYTLNDEGVLNIIGTGKIKQMFFIDPSENDIIIDVNFLGIIIDQLVQEYENTNIIDLQFNLNMVDILTTDVYTYLSSYDTLVDAANDGAIWQIDNTLENLQIANDAQLLAYIFSCDDIIITEENASILLNIIKIIPRITIVNVGEGITDLGDYKQKRYNESEVENCPNYIFTGLSWGDGKGQLSDAVTYNFPSSLKRISYALLSSAHANVNFNEGIEVIGSDAFQNAEHNNPEAEAMVTINKYPSSITTIEYGAFMGPITFVDKTADLSNLHTYSNNAFYKANFTKIILPNNIDIFDIICYECTNLTEVIVPTNIKTLMTSFNTSTISGDTNPSYTLKMVGPERNDFVNASGESINLNDHYPNIVWNYID